MHTSRKLGLLSSAFAAIAMTVTPASAAPPIRSVKDLPWLPRPGEVCAPIVETREVIGKMPVINKIFARMTYLPETGMPLFSELIVPEYGFTVCATPKSMMSTAGVYNPKNNKLKITAGNSFGTMSDITAHEGFHGMQDANDTDNIWYGSAPKILTKKDMFTLYLLAEAAAVAYNYIYQKEADAQFPGTFKTFIGSRNNTDIPKIFEQAYAEGQQKFSSEAKVLEYAGQAVVTALLEGKNEGWLKFYKETNMAWITKGTFVTTRDPKYDEALRRALTAMGKVSDDINLTPPSVIWSVLPPPKSPLPKMNGA